jgi:hypothetical protein
VVVTFVGRFDKGVVALLLDRRGAGIIITEEVVKAAAGNKDNGKEVMTLLRDRLGADLLITEEVVKAAAGNADGGKVIQYLHGISAIKVTDVVIESAATSGQEKTLYLFNQWAGTNIVLQQWIYIAQLCAAAKEGVIKIVLQLVEKGTPLDKKDIRGTTPLWHAASKGHTDVVRVLLATNAVDVNAQSVAQRTPLFWPAASGFVEVVELLLGHGARQNYTDADGRSLLAIAKHYYQADVVDILVKDNAKKSAASRRRYKRMGVCKSRKQKRLHKDDNKSDLGTIA